MANNYNICKAICNCILVSLLLNYSRRRKSNKQLSNPKFYFLNEIECMKKKLLNYIKKYFNYINNYYLNYINK